MKLQWQSGTRWAAAQSGARTLLCSTYLRPLRDAERAMSAGRSSRLSQILQHTREIKDNDAPYNPAQ